MDDLAIIRRAIEEHHKLRTNVRLAGEAVNDMEALFNLQQAHAAWGQGSIKELSDAVARLQQTVAGLGQGLNAHFGFEEQYLPPVLGTNLMKAIVLEHDEVRQKLHECAASVAADLTGQPQEKLLAFRNLVQQMVSDLSHAIESHASREEIVLGMLARALVKESQGKPV